MEEAKRSTGQHGGWLSYRVSRRKMSAQKIWDVFFFFWGGGGHLSFQTFGISGYKYKSE